MLIVSEPATSLRITQEVERRHKDVLETIRSAISELDVFDQRNFRLTEYTDTRGRVRPRGGRGPCGPQSRYGFECLCWKSSTSLVSIAKYCSQIDTTSRSVPST
jgi:phage regulator Rha-like protein